MGELFQGLREHGRPTYYGENRTAVIVDKVTCGIIFAFLILGFSFYVILIGVRGIERLCAFIRITVTLFIGAVILVCNFGYGWEYGYVVAKMDYKAFSAEQVKVELGLKVGLRGINITLVGIPKDQLNTTIDYNERFSWQWSQGKPGYGLQAGKLNRQYRAAQIKGLPYPILWLLEYFTIDEGNFRYGRYYRTAGWYCHIALWVALPLWLLSNILFCMVVRYGANYLALTGGVLLLSNVLFASIRNPVPSDMRFDSKELVLRYSWCFYLVLFTGILCIILAAVILFMDLRYPEEIATFFGIDILQDYEDFYADPADLGLVPPVVRSDSSSAPVSPSDATYGSQDVFSLRKRTVSKRFQKTTRKKMPLPSTGQQATGHKELRIEGKHDVPVYENINLTRFDPIGEEEEESREGSQDEIVVEHKS